MNDIRIQKTKYDQMVHLWPITVEIYPTGQVAFIARPGGRGKRWNKTFSTSTFESPELAAGAAVDFCKRVLSGTDEDVKYVQKVREEKKIQKKLASYQMTEEEFQLHLKAKKLGIDVKGALIGLIRTKWGGLK